MVNKIKKSIANAKGKDAFIKRKKERSDRKKAKSHMEKNQFVDKKSRREEKVKERKGKADKDEDEEMGENTGSEISDDFEKEMEAQEAELKAEKALDETMFAKYETGELDLPEDDDGNDLDAEESSEDDKPVDEELEDYYRELGIEPEDMQDKKDADAVLYKKQKKEKKEKKEGAKISKAQRQRSEVLNQMMEKARNATNVTALNRIIQVVKTVFGEKKDKQLSKKEQEKGAKAADEDEEMKDETKGKKKTQIFSQALNSVEYVSLLKFFSAELPTLILKIAEVGEFPNVDTLIKKKHYKKNKAEFDLKKAYGSMAQKHQILMKSFAANYTRLLASALSEDSNASGQFIGHFFGNGADAARCCIPYKVYQKKMSNLVAKVSVSYSQMDKTTIVLAFTTLRSLVTWSQDNVLFEATLKRMYNEFAKESKVGGGGYSVQDRLRLCQNCFVELLSQNRAVGYQLGFQYLRQLCLHLRTIRNSLTKDAVKNIYSWQFYNCMKIWVLALTTASTSDLVLLVHPLVQLIVGVIRLTNNIKYFPFHLKAFELLSIINSKTGQFVPAAQYILYPFDSANQNYFGSKPRPLSDKIIPESLVSLKIAKKHVDTQEMKDRIVKEALEALTQYFAANSESLSFPELVLPTCVILRKFKKNSNSPLFKKHVTSFLDQIKRNEDFIAAERAKIRDKNLRDPAKLHQQFALQVSNATTPLSREFKIMEARKAETMQRKLDAYK